MTRKRVMFDFVSGYKHKPMPPAANMSLKELREKGYAMDEHAWLNVSVLALLSI